MVTRQIVFRTAAAAALLTLVAAYGGGGSASTTAVFEAKLSGAEEVPPVTGTASGTAEVQVNRNTNMLTYKVSFTGLSGPATGAHIHGPAEKGKNAGIVVPFANVTTQPVEGQMAIRPEQMTDLRAGRWYVNIHTAANPGGEIRGQLRERK